MRIMFSVFVVSCALLCACRSGVQRKEPKSAAETRLTPVQREYVRKYLVMRKRVTDFLKLPESAPLEEIRPLVAAFLKLPAQTSWEDMIRSPIVGRFLTEERRKKCVSNLGLLENTTWVEIGFAAERLRKEL